MFTKCLYTLKVGLQPHFYNYILCGDEDARYDVSNIVQKKRFLVDIRCCLNVQMNKESLQNIEIPNCVGNLIHHGVVEFGRSKVLFA